MKIEKTETFIEHDAQHVYKKCGFVKGKTHMYEMTYKENENA